MIAKFCFEKLTLNKILQKSPLKKNILLYFFKKISEISEMRAEKCGLRAWRAWKNPIPAGLRACGLGPSPFTSLDKVLNLSYFNRSVFFILTWWSGSMR